MKECTICGNEKMIPVYSATLKKCLNCGFATVNMELSRELLEKTYSLNYFLGEEYLDYLQDKEILQLNFEKRIQAITKITDGKLPISNCLEIGCAYDFFGELLQKNRNTGYLGMNGVPEAIAYGRDVFVEYFNKHF